MEIIVTFLVIILAMNTYLPTKKIPEDQVVIPNELPGSQLTLNHRVRPLSKINFEGVVKQKYDYSCGSAALATVLNYYLHENLTEHQIIQGLMQYGDAKQIEQRRAFSLLDMKRFVGVLGYKASGYTAEIEDLKSLKTPAIIPVEIYNYKHFVVFRGIYKDHVFFADPYLGNISFPLSQFEKMWFENIAFIITNEDTKFNALALTEQDLRIVHFSMQKPPLIAEAYESIVDNQRDFIESYGKYQYVRINVR